MRNHYETRIGKFKRAVDPCTPAFRDFPFWVEDKFQLPKSDCEHSIEEVEGKTVNPEENSPPRVAMYCTGGIRCEKASSYLLSKGFKEVMLVDFYITWFVFLIKFGHDTFMIATLYKINVCI